MYSCRAILCLAVWPGETHTCVVRGTPQTATPSSRTAKRTGESLRPLIFRSKVVNLYFPFQQQHRFTGSATVLLKTMIDNKEQKASFHPHSTGYFHKNSFSHLQVYKCLWSFICLFFLLCSIWRWSFGLILYITLLYHVDLRLNCWMILMKLL